MELPSKYENKSGNPQFEKFIGKPKLSYSAYNSFKEPAYKGEFFGTYFLKEPRGSTIFTLFGGSVGVFLETGEPQEYLSNSDMEILRSEIGRPEGSVYEQEIVIDRGEYVIQGFIDRVRHLEEGVEIIDFKTGSIDKKKLDYAHADYNQTTLYAYALEQMGCSIGYSGVKLADRKGNTLESGNKNVLRLTGEVLDIPTPYSKERAESFLESFDKVAKEIEQYYKTYLKFFK